MATQYLPFNTAALAQNQSKADWAQKILRHPTLSTAVTDTFWGWIVNPNDLTALGVFTDDVMATVNGRWTPTQIATLNASLLPADDPRVVATLAAIAAANPPIP